MKYILSLLVLTLLLVPSQAKEPYTLAANGLYTGSDGQSYVRKDNWTWIPPVNYYSCGRCVSTTAGYWRFDNYSYTAYAPPVITSKDPYWRNRLADALVIKAKQEADLILAANEQNAFLETIQELGLTGALKGSGLYPELAMPYRNKYIIPASPTIYSSAAIETQIYGALDRNVLYQQASAFSRDALAMAERSQALNIASLDKEGLNASRWAEILAKGVSASRTLQAADAAPSATIRENYLTPAVGPPQGLQLTQRRAQAIRACVQCHSGQQAQGGYQVASHWSLPYEKQMEAVRRMTLDPRDPQAMPKGGQRQHSSIIAEFLPAEERARIGQ